jgi:hypothetical protein
LLLNPATAELFHDQTGDNAVKRAFWFRLVPQLMTRFEFRDHRGGGCGVPFYWTRTTTTQSMRQARYALESSRRGHLPAVIAAGDPAECGTEGVGRDHCDKRLALPRMIDAARAGQ